jgi:hypothetical protein
MGTYQFAIGDVSLETAMTRLNSTVFIHEMYFHFSCFEEWGGVKGK